MPHTQVSRSRIYEVLLMCHYSLAISPLEASLWRENYPVLIMLSIVLFTASRAALTLLPCLTTTIHMSSSFGACQSHQERALSFKTLYPQGHTFREFAVWRAGHDRHASWRKDLACVNVLTRREYETVLSKGKVAQKREQCTDADEAQMQSLAGSVPFIAQSFQPC